MASDFIREAVKEDLRNGRFDHVHTRFPPSPTAYLHIGHAKAVWIDYGIAQDFGGLFNLRFDDTNPAKEEQEFVDAIIEDVRWLGADWDDRLFFALATTSSRCTSGPIELIKKGKAYVCDLSADEVSEYARHADHARARTAPTATAPSRRTSTSSRACGPASSPTAPRTLRAKIDMASPQPQPARPGHVPHPARRAPPPGRQVVHLPDV